MISYEEFIALLFVDTLHLYNWTSFYGSHNY